MGLVHAGMARHGTAVFTHEQTRGRGQRSRAWVSQTNSNIAISLILEPEHLAISQMFLLSMAVAAGTARFFNKYTSGEVRIKWPNDVYWRDRKAGGILIENILQGKDWRYAIAGIGLNINQVEFGELDLKAVSLKQITGIHFQPLSLAKELCGFLEESFALSKKDPSSVIEQYKSRLYKLNEVVRLKKGSRVFEATIKDVTLNGDLVVEHTVEERFGVGEVEWLI